MTISTGESRPPENSLARMSKACLDSALVGSVVTPAKPVLMPRYGIGGDASSSPPPTTRLMTGWLMTTPVTRSQKPPGSCHQPSASVAGSARR